MKNARKTEPVSANSTPDQSNAVTFEVDARDFDKALSGVSFACAVDKPRLYMNGVYIAPCPDGGGLRLVATDGYRLSLREIPVNGLSSFKGVIVHRKDVFQIHKLLRPLLKKGGAIMVEVTKKNIRFGHPTHQTTFELINKKFPDYERAIPRHNTRLVTVNRAALTVLTSQLVVAACDIHRMIRIELGCGHLIATATKPFPDTEPNHAAGTVDAVDAGTGAFHTAIDGQYLLDILTSFFDAEITIAFAGHPLDPILFRPATGGADLAVVMPMRI